VASRFENAGPLRGRLTAPADKSISHRAGLLGAMGEGETVVEGYLASADTDATLAAVRAIGADVTRDGGVVRISGVGLRGAASADIEVGNAGTLMRLLPGWLAGQDAGKWTLDGDSSIRRRPVDRISAPLREMGAEVAHEPGGLPPLRVQGAALRGIRYEMPVASAQVKSCLMLAGLTATGPTSIVEGTPSRDHTERMLRAAGASVTSEEGVVTVHPAEAIRPGRINVPGDISSAAFFITAAAVVPGSDVLIEGIGLNPTRTGFITVMQRMGADIEVEEEGEEGGEPIGSIRVRSAQLAATEVGGDEIPSLIDELPLVALAASFAEGRTVIRDAAELRRKESDRIATVRAALVGVGAEVEETSDGLVVEGAGALRGGHVSAHGDHRIAMLGAIAGVASTDGVDVEGMDAAAVSYPAFEGDLAKVAG
jgi:3-phosphoshikimate 1-carboxyvinyltransferase